MDLLFVIKKPKVLNIDGLHYIPNIISDEAHDALLMAINSRKASA